MENFYYYLKKKNLDTVIMVILSILTVLSFPNKTTYGIFRNGPYYVLPYIGLVLFFLVVIFGTSIYASAFILFFNIGYLLLVLFGMSVDGYYFSLFRYLRPIIILYVAIFIISFFLREKKKDGYMKFIREDSDKKSKDKVLYVENQKKPRN